MTAFSNGTEWDAWSAGWCARCVAEESCDIILNVMMENTVPPEWTPGPRVLGPGRYECSDFVPMGVSGD